MGNLFSPIENLSPLASVARDVCPFPNYDPSPLFGNMLSPDSSLHLKNHYRAVQSSLNPQQLEDFTQSLRTTFGREGKVTLGGVGVVALSLAVLFDTLAKQAKGEWVSDSGPIPGLFPKDLRGYYPPHVYTVSEYLRLVPHIANNPTRMREETERYIKKLKKDDQSLNNLGENHTLPLTEDVTYKNWILGQFFTISLQLHLRRIKNSTADEPTQLGERTTTLDIVNVNCDPEAADKDFLAQVQNSDNTTREVFERYFSDKETPNLLHVAGMEWMNVMFRHMHIIYQSKTAQGEDFNLKANALGKWA